MSNERGGRRTPAVEVRANLLAAGRVILERDGVAGLTIRAVATEAEVAPMGVYNHFEGKEGLLDGLVTSGFRDLDEAIRVVDTAPLARLRSSGRRYREFALANPVLYGLMFSADCTPDPVVAGRAFEGLAEILRYGQAAGEVVEGDPYELALQAWSAVHGAVGLELAGAAPPVVDIGSNYENVIAMVARGLRR